MPRPERPQAVLLTGPSGAGKSALAAALRRRGWALLDGDALAKSLYLPGGALLRSLAREFGPGVLAADGGLDARALGDLVFRSTRRRRALNRLVFPAFLRALRARLRAARAARRRLVLDVAVYFEMGAPSLGAPAVPVVLVTAPLAERVRRLRRLGLEAGRARARARALRFGPAARRRADLELRGLGRAQARRALFAFLGEKP